ncbi:MAG: adenylosuccinate synthetase [Candidatus Aenigmatarchaeota archaeon]
MHGPKHRISTGGDYGDTGKGGQNSFIIRELIEDLGLQNNPDYENAVLRDPLDVLANKPAVLSIGPNGSGNAGNNIYLPNGNKVSTHLLPPGIVWTPYAISILGPLKRISLERLHKEITEANQQGCKIVPGKNLFLDEYATITLPQDIALDLAMNKEMKGTRSGSGPTSARRTARTDPRAADLLNLDSQEVRARIEKGVRVCNAQLREFGEPEISFEETMNWLRKWTDEFSKWDRDSETKFIIRSKKLVDLALHNPNAYLFVNGTQAPCLDLDFGSVGKTVSYGVSLHEILKGAYLPAVPRDPDNYAIYLIKKGYVTRAGSGFFPGEFTGEKTEFLAEIGGEIGVTSGNRRRTGANNIAETRYQIDTTAPVSTLLRITKLDIFGEFMEKYGPQRAIIGYKLPNGEVVDHLSFEGEFEVIWSEPYHWGKLSPEEVKKIVEQGFDVMPDGMKAYLLMEAELTGAPIVAVGLGPLLNDTVTKGLYEGTIEAAKRCWQQAVSI